MGEERDCDECRYADVLFDVYPCSDCYNPPTKYGECLWEPQEEESE